MTTFIATRLMMIMMVALLLAAIGAVAVGFNNPLYEP